jgi:DNA-binding MarR family transcriptional regulator
MTQTARGAGSLRPTKGSISQQAAVALLRVADLVRRDAARVLEPLDLTLQQFNVLRILRGAGESGLPTLEVGARMIEQTPGITRLLDRLELKGYIRRERCRQDRRQHLCWITPAGREVLAQAHEPMEAAHESSLRTLGTYERQRLRELLDQVTDANQVSRGSPERNGRTASPPEVRPRPVRGRRAR